MTVEYDDTNGGVIMCVSLGLFLIVIAFLSWAFFFHPNAILKKHLPNRQFKCVECHHTESHKHQKLAEYFRKKGSPCPEEMAHGVVRTKNPRLFAAICAVESGGNPAVRKTGFRHRHDGAFQVSRKHWGEAPHDAVGQALQAEVVLDSFLKDRKGNLVKALNDYGGDKTHRRYAKVVLAELRQVP